MLRVAFIGAGQMARHHIEAFARTGVDVSIVGVHDRIAARSDDLAAFAQSRSFTSAAALLADTRPDVVHICTPPAAHFAAALEALEGGAHVYVEKPFARTLSDARALLDLASARRLLVCAGHQLLRDPGFERLMAYVPSLGTLVHVDSHFAFKPATLQAGGGSAPRLAGELIDILPHPLYALISVLERFGDAQAPIALAWAHADAAHVQAILQRGRLIGRLSVSVVARPVASWLTIMGTQGSLTCDFVRSIVVGAGNPGTEALEKVLNPMIEGAQLAGRTAMSVAGRLCGSGSYPGLAESIGGFHCAVASNGPPPLSPAHLMRVTEVFEKLVARIEAASRRSALSRRHSAVPIAEPLTVVTGARGFLGSEISRRLPYVRGIGRSGWPDDAPVHEWVSCDLSTGVRPEALAKAAVVIHAAAETSGGFTEHQRNTIIATRHLLNAMHAAGVHRLVLVSSLSVVRPPRTGWERQDEDTPRPSEPASLGPYTWGKSRQEELVVRDAAALGIETRIIRPGALVDWRDPALPGIMGRRLFGRWHLGLGRPRLPVAACGVEECAAAIAWCAQHFDEAPPVVNLFDPSIATRGDLVTAFRERAWAGRVCWVPISVIALGMTTARTLLALAARRLPTRLDAWSILRPRRFDGRVSATLFDAVRRSGVALEGSANGDPFRAPV